MTRTGPPRRWRRAPAWWRTGRRAGARVSRLTRTSGSFGRGRWVSGQERGTFHEPDQTGTGDGDGRRDGAEREGANGDRRGRGPAQEQQRREGERDDRQL